MLHFFDSSFYMLPELYNWALSTGVAAILLIISATVILLWSLFRSRRVWWLSILFLLLLGGGIWSLIVTLIGFQQLNDFIARLAAARPIHGSPAYIHYVLGTAYGADVQRCQIQFWITLSLLMLLVIAGLWRLITHFVKKDGPRSEGTGESAHSFS